MTRLQVGDAELEVRASGSGPAVVLHPSLGRWARDFDPIVPGLVEAGYQAVAVEPRGVAGSTGPAGSLTLDVLAADLAGVVEHVGAPVHLVGHAFGNRVCRQLASSRPEVVRSVTLLGAGGRVPGDPEARAAVGASFDLDAPLEDRLAAVALAFFAPGNDPAVWTDGWFPGAMRAQTGALLAARSDDWWNAGRVPMLVVQGLQDRAAPPENGRMLLTDRPGHTELVEIDGAGHALIPERPAEVTNAIVDFLDRQR
ncbi:MAG: alpha/beta hydrolase [Acidimicrobiales bacterium]|nr:alpha/beta hydrolase [Acidimicrobiales bacterium]